MSRLLVISSPELSCSMAIPAITAKAPSAALFAAHHALASPEAGNKSYPATSEFTALIMAEMYPYPNAKAWSIFGSSGQVGI